ncbi:MAG: FtsX-like permease family protein [Gammaproteobacteria bacterium]|nr:FtsX-like permease family protein [Gammaproteobacteria bacterium]
MLKLAFRNIFRQKARMLLTLMVIAFGVVGLILSGGFVEDIFVQLREATIHSRLGHIQVYSKGYYEYGRRDPYEYMIAEPKEVVEQLGEWPEVEEILQRLNFFGLLNNGKTDIPIMGEGVQPDKEARLGSYFFIAEGRALTAEDEYGVLLGEGVAASLQVGPGDYVNLLLSTKQGSLNSLELEVVGTFRTFSKEYDDRAIRLPLERAKELTDTEQVHALVLLLASNTATDRLADYLDQVLGPLGYEVWTWVELDDFYPKTVELYKGQFGFLQGIILLIVLLSVLSSVSMTMNERVGEFGTLRAIGLRSSQLFRQALLENVILGAGGGALGVILGIALALIISEIGIPMPPPPNSNTPYTAYIRIVPDILVTAFIVGFAATFFSALLAARRPVKTPIVDALRQNI